jgi:hypothetical protein
VDQGCAARAGHIASGAAVWDAGGDLARVAGGVGEAAGVEGLRRQAQPGLIHPVLSAESIGEPSVLEHFFKLGDGGLSDASACADHWRAWVGNHPVSETHRDTLQAHPAAPQ